MIPLSVRCTLCGSPVGYPCRTAAALDGGFVRNLALGLVEPLPHSRRYWDALAAQEVKP